MTKKKHLTENSQFWIEYGIDIENRKIMLDEYVDEYSVGFRLRGFVLHI